MGSLLLLLLLLLAPALAGGAANYREQYALMDVDHFSHSEQGSFLLRYLVNDTFWDPDSGPVLFVPGGEAAVEFFAQNMGFLWRWAAEARALLLLAEHRYQGASLPFGSAAFSSGRSLGYLSVQQALADSAALLAHLKDSVAALARAPVVAVGAGYSGQLAAWLRMRYPHIFLGAVASSAPVLEQAAPCGDFAAAVTAAYNATSPGCAAAVARIWKVLGRYDQPAGLRRLAAGWRLCRPLAHLQPLKDWLANALIHLAEADLPYPACVLWSLPARPLKEACARLEAGAGPGPDSWERDEALLAAAFDLASLLFNGTGAAACLDLGGPVTLRQASAARLYQDCTELGAPRCAAGWPTDMFEPTGWDWAAAEASCRARWGRAPRPRFVAETLGSPALGAASNLLFTYGERDPAAAGGLLRNVTGAVQTLRADGAPPALDLRAPHPADPPATRRVRAAVQLAVAAWLRDAPAAEPRRRR